MDSRGPFFPTDRASAYSPGVRPRPLGAWVHPGDILKVHRRALWFFQFGYKHSMAQQTERPVGRAL